MEFFRWSAPVEAHSTCIYFSSFQEGQHGLHVQFAREGGVEAQLGARLVGDCHAAHAQAGGLAQPGRLSQIYQPA